jgi:hypothetical protein
MSDLDYKRLLICYAKVALTMLATGGGSKSAGTVMLTSGWRM